MQLVMMISSGITLSRRLNSSSPLLSPRQPTYLWYSMRVSRPPCLCGLCSEMVRLLPPAMPLNSSLFPAVTPGTGSSLTSNSHRPPSHPR
jgi:hypothetical protein